MYWRDSCHDLLKDCGKNIDKDHGRLDIDKDHGRLEGAWLKYCPKGGVLQKRRFCYNNDGLLKDYMRIMMIMGGLC